MGKSTKGGATKGAELKQKKSMGGAMVGRSYESIGAKKEADLRITNYKIKKVAELQKSGAKKGRNNKKRRS